MKILITTDLYSTSTNGVVTSVRNLRDELIKKGHDLRILTTSESMVTHKEDFVYYIKSLPLGRIYPDLRMPVSYRNGVIQEIIDWKPDVIHSQCEFFSFQFASYIARKTGAPLVHTYHTLYEQYVPYVLPNRMLGQNAVRTFSKTRLRNVSRVIAPTRKVEDALIGYGVSKPISVIPSGISLKQFEKRLTEEEKFSLRRKLGIPDNHQVVLSLGRLGEEKNLEELVDFFARELAVKPYLTFLIVGDGPARQHLEEMAEKLGVQENVIFAGMVDPSQVRDYYQIGDVFVCASTSETQGLTYIEAAANGLPLLCREDPCLDGVIQEGVNGYEYTDGDDFLEKLNRILENASWRLRAGIYSREVAKSYDKEYFAASVEAVYESVVA